MPPSPARANPLLAPVPCQAWTDLVRIPDGMGGTSQRTIFTVVHSAGITSVFLDAGALDTWIELLTDARGQMSGLITPGPGPAVPPGLGPPNGTRP